jgi:hypothetical protein
MLEPWEAGVVNATFLFIIFMIIYGLLRYTGVISPVFSY